MTTGCLTQALVVALTVVPRSAAESPGAHCEQNESAYPPIANGSRTCQRVSCGPGAAVSNCSKWAERLFLVLVRFSVRPRQAAATQAIEIFFQRALVTSKWSAVRRGGGASSAAVVRTPPSMTRATIVVFGSRSEGFRLRDASRYPMSEGFVLRSCLDPPQRSVRTSAADLRSNRPGTDYRVDPL